jgi:alpha-L-fucosidase
MKKISALILLLFTGTLLKAQEHKMPKSYVVPADTLVQKKLIQWHDLKFGLFMHWGPYSEWGVVESWSLCPEDAGFTQRKGPYSANYYDYKKAYENLLTTFNPTKFNPEKWVKAAKNAGMKYVVFTTKHHDGFSMFDTKQTDYKVTSSRDPFSSNPRSNVTKEIFNAFRKENFMIGAYFSKPDWHSDYYWWSYFPPMGRNVNYDPAKYPDRWQKFKDFTYNQIGELMTDYGKVDILWLDGGWVRPKYTLDNTSAEYKNAYNQDIDMANIAAMSRKKQPGLIIVDRTVSGEFENYTTPEQQVPNEPLDHPWESCITMGNSWSYVPGDQYKSTNQIISLLVKIVSRGGNLLMNIGPGPDGDWDPIAYRRLNEIGEWIKVNGEGIYESDAVAPYSEGNIFYTKSKNSNTIYAFSLSDNDKVKLPGTITLHLKGINKIKKVSLLGVDRKIKFGTKMGELTINIPTDLQDNNNLTQTATFKIQY